MCEISCDTLIHVHEEKEFFTLFYIYIYICACNNEKLFAYLLEKLNEKYDSVRWRFVVKISFLEIFSSTYVTHFLCKFIEENWDILNEFCKLRTLVAFDFYDGLLEKTFFVYELFGEGPAKLGSWKEFN